ncbi:MAG: hypothetical protein C0501_19125 [Isosphaera sp.]|nr:hypothetical protein [Isosphaera sp.]
MMATLPCPGCGLPRAADEVGVVACPVCASAPAVAVARPAAASPDPTAGLPADAGQLAAHPAVGGRNGAVLAAGGFAAGVLAVLAWQAAFPRPRPPVAPAHSPPAVAADTPPAANPPPKSAAPPVAVAPPPREVAAGPVEVAVAPPPRPAPIRHPGPVVVIELNEPGESYSLPRGIKAGAHVVLRGKVGTLHLRELTDGTVVDASGLEAADVSVSGGVSGGSVLKLNAPDGRVTIKGRLGEKSVVEVNAPGGDVRVNSSASRGTAEPSVGGGARLAVTALGVEVRGSVAGDGTRVAATLGKHGRLTVHGGVRGTAAVEYRTVVPNDPTVLAEVGTVAPTAVFRRVN